ncbi:MAG: glycosyltransferase [Bacteroidales bacterium]|nr:glycosyltransferase [Bacteroidales bacterium]
MIKISIIIPIYKTEKYIVHCVKSIIPFLSQYTECIFIDDGSPDNALSLAVNLVKGFNYKTIQQPNSGLSVARNNGILNSNGEYVFFLDSDDWIDGDINFLYNYAKLKNLDILSFNFKKYYECCRKLVYSKKNIPPQIMTGSEYFFYLQKNNLFNELTQIYLYRREFLIANNLFFLEGIKHEDNEFTPRAILLSKRIAYLENPIYIYRKRENSITTTIDSKRLFDLLLITESLNKFQEINKNDNILISKGLAIYGARFLKKILYLNALLKISGQIVEDVKVKVKNSKFLRESVHQCDVFKVKLEGLLILHFFTISLYLYQYYLKFRNTYAKFKNRSDWKK